MLRVKLTISSTCLFLSQEKFHFPRFCDRISIQTHMLNNFHTFYWNNFVSFYGENTQVWRSNKEVNKIWFQFKHDETHFAFNRKILNAFWKGSSGFSRTETAIKVVSCNSSNETIANENQFRNSDKIILIN